MTHNLLELGNDMLLEVFSNFTIIELIEIASVCTRLKDIARKVFVCHHKWKCLHINLTSNSIRIENVNYVVSALQILQVLRNFGNLITKLTITFHRDVRDKFVKLNTNIFNMTVMYCTGKLDKLAIYHCRTLETGKFLDATALFRNVKDLVISSSDAIISSFMSEARELQKFSMSYHPEKPVEFLSYEFNQLQSLCGIHVGSNSELIELNLKRFENLTELEIMVHSYEYEDVDDPIDLSLIAELLKLRKFSINSRINSRIELKPLAKLPNLTTLQLHVTSNDLIEFLKTSMSFDTLEKLEISLCRSEVDRMQIMEVLTRFVRLKQFALCFPQNEFEAMPITDDNLINLVQHLPELNQLKFHLYIEYSSLHLKKSTYLQICKICRNRKQQLAIYGCDDECFLPEEIAELYPDLSKNESVKFFCLSDPYLDIVYI